MYARTKRASAAVFIGASVVATVLVVVLARVGPTGAWLVPLVLGMTLLAYLDGRFARTE